MCIRDSNIRYIDKITPSANMFATGSHVGLEFPLAGTAVGKAILSELSEAEVKAVWDDSQIVQYTPNTICDLDRLLEELKDTRKMCIRDRVPGDEAEGGRAQSQEQQVAEV